jgi:hypothetical protein
MIRRAFARGTAAGLLALLAVPWAFAAHAGVSVALSPVTQTVAPGAEFEVTVAVTAAGSPFNAFDLIVGYDPAALTPVPLSPLTDQIGPLVKNACPTQFHRFHASAGADTANYSMLCSNTSVSGPGTIYRLRFRAATTARTTTLRFRPGTAFFNAGIVVAGVQTQDAAVGIGMSATLDAGQQGPGLSLAAAPNPSRDGTRLDFGAPLPAAATLRVADVQGRTVRTLDVPAGARSAGWDGRDGSGLRLPPGRYAVALTGPGVRLHTQVTLVR